MLDYFKLFRALQTDEYDDVSVRDLKAEFDTIPDIANGHVDMFPESITFTTGVHRLETQILKMVHEGRVLIIDNAPVPPFLETVKNELIAVKSFNTEPIIEYNPGLPDHKEIKRTKNQNNLRSRNFKK